MKFQCECDYIFVDQTDNLPFKADIYPDQSIEAMYKAVDKIFESQRPNNDLEYDRMIDAIFSPVGRRTMYQCPKCGRIYIEENDGRLSCFVPESENVSKNLLEGGNK